MTKPFIKSLKISGRFKRLAGHSAKTEGLKSGLVSLKPGEAIGCHCTKDKEEALIILEGRARVFYGKKQGYAGKDSFVFIPRDTMHDVKNIGPGQLRYVYVTSKAKHARG